MSEFMWWRDACVYMYMCVVCEARGHHHALILRSHPSCILKQFFMAGEMVQQLKALAALLKDPSSIPSTYLALHNCL